MRVNFRSEKWCLDEFPEKNLLPEKTYEVLKTS